MADTTATKNIQVKFTVISKGAPGFEKATNKMTKSIRNVNKEGMKFRVMTSGMRRIIGAVRNEILIVTFALVGFVRAISNTIKNANKLQSSLVGLQSVARNTGASMKEATDVAKKLADTGLLSVSQASASLKNLLATGIGLPKATELMYAFADSAAFNRQGSLSLGEALEGATEGYKNMLSMKVDNAGITKNLSLMEKDYANAIGKTVGVLTEMERRQAHYLGILKEAKMFENDRLSVMGLLSGQLSKLNTVMFNMSAAIGRTLQPAITVFVRQLVIVAKQTKLWVEVNKDLIQIQIMGFVRAFSTGIGMVISSLKMLLGVFGKIITVFPNFTNSIFPAFLAALAIMKVRTMILTATMGKLAKAISNVFVATRFMGLAGGLTAVLASTQLLFIAIFAALVLLFTGIKKLLVYLDRQRVVLLELNILRRKELQLIKEKNDEQNQENTSELRSIQNKINLNGRLQDLVDKEEELITKIRERSRLQRRIALQESEMAIRAMMLEKGAKEAYKKFATKRTSTEIGRTRRGVPIVHHEYEIESLDLSKMTEREIMNRGRLNNLSTQQLDIMIKLREEHVKQNAIRKFVLGDIERAEVFVDVIEREEKGVKKLITAMRRQIVLGKLSSDFEKDKQKLSYKYMDNINKINEYEKVSTEIRKEAQKINRELYEDDKKRLAILNKLEIAEEKRKKVAAIEEVNAAIRNSMQITKNQMALDDSVSAGRREYIRIQQEYELRLKAINKEQGADNKLVKEAIALAKQRREQQIEGIEPDKPPSTFEERLGDIGKKYRKASQIAGMVGGASGAAMAIRIEKDLYDELLREKMEYGMSREQMERDHLSKMQGLNLNYFEALKNQLKQEATLKSSYQAMALEGYKHLTNITENISRAFFDGEVRRQLTLKKVTGSIAYEVLAIQLDVLKQYAIAKITQFVAETAGQMALGNVVRAAFASKAVAGYAVLAGVAGAAAGEARSRAAEHISGGNDTGVITDTTGGAGTRKYGSTTQLPAQNITIAPSVTINSGGGSIMVTGGGVEVLEREIAEMVVKTVENAVRSQEIDLVGVGRR